jgi:hypothetical protein
MLLKLEGVTMYVYTAHEFDIMMSIVLNIPQFLDTRVDLTDFTLCKKCKAVNAVMNYHL